MKVLAAILTVLALSGCSGISYVMQEYNHVSPTNFQASSGTAYRVFDRPEANKLMITPSIGGAVVQGLTFGASKEPGLAFEGAANEWLTANGRANCKAARTVSILDQQHEVFYECSR